MPDHFDIPTTNEHPPVAYWHDGAVWVEADPGDPQPWRVIEVGDATAPWESHLPEGAVPLVPATDLDVLTAQHDANAATIAELRESVDTLAADSGKYAVEANGLAHLLDRICAIVGHTGKSVDLLPEAVDQAIVHASEVGVFSDRCPEPDATNPEHCRFAAGIVSGAVPNDEYGDAIDAIALRARADRLEREAAQADIEEQEIAEIAAVLGAFAIADEHSGERDDRVLAANLHRRGIRVLRTEATTTGTERNPDDHH